MMNYTIRSVSIMGTTTDNEDIYHVALLNEGKYIDIGLRTYYMLYINRADGKSILKDYTCIPLYTKEYSEDDVDARVNQISKGAKWVECLLTKVDSPPGGYRDEPYRLYVLLNSNTIKSENENNTLLLGKHYEYPENDYLENKLEYDKLLEKYIVEMKIGGEDHWRDYN